MENYIIVIEQVNSTLTDLKYYVSRYQRRNIKKSFHEKRMIIVQIIVEIRIATFRYHLLCSYLEYPTFQDRTHHS